MPSPAVNLILRNPFDKEAAEFCSRSGATDRRAISDFVRGIKALGLWNSMVCWPMRSAQNAGGVSPTDTTVHSLGGLGTYPGTRVNGPVWGADGIVFDGTNDYIQTTQSETLSHTLFAVFAPTGSGAVECVFGSLGYAQSTQQVATLSGTNEGAVSYASQNALHGSMLAGQHMLVCQWDTVGDTVKSSRSGGAVVSSAWTGGITDNKQTIGAAIGTNGDSGPNYFAGTVAMAGVIKGLNIGSSGNLYALYKATLGQGLSLP